mgnify:FL=1
MVCFCCRCRLFERIHHRQHLTHPFQYYLLDMKLISEHEIDIRLMKAGRRIRIVGTQPTIMLSVNDVFKGWFENTDDAWKALEKNRIHLKVSNDSTVR